MRLIAGRPRAAWVALCCGALWWLWWCEFGRTGPRWYSSTRLGTRAACPGRSGRGSCRPFPSRLRGTAATGCLGSCHRPNRQKEGPPERHPWRVGAFSAL
ncbi:hypothetical protein DFJ73DRAFT_851361 [Zopfochytrium polystomum]|nr:hypothetical protein DFJ73DRAFT_851361 [Zopfochytrium polystomum]